MIATASSLPSSALIVDPSPDDRAFFADTLIGSGFHVVVAETFHEARELLVHHHPNIIVTELRLGEYNGLHLLMRAKARHQDLAAIVTSTWLDPVLQAETERMRGTFLPKPIAREDALAAVLRTCFRDSAEDAPIRPPFERRQTIRRVALLPVDGESERRRLAERRRHYALSPDSALVIG